MKRRSPRLHMVRTACSLSFVALLASACTSGAEHATADGGAEDAAPAACLIPEPLVLTAAEDGGPPCGDVLTTLVRETCVGGICHHGGASPAAGLDLLSRCAADRLVGVTSTCNGRELVDPDDVDRSFVIEKLTVDPPECGGESMPYDNHLGPRDLACMRQWIAAIATAAPSR